jgi:hypothetical protein
MEHGATSDELIEDGRLKMEIKGVGRKRVEMLRCKPPAE